MPPAPPFPPWRRLWVTLPLGALAGLGAGVTMLLVMALLRLGLGLATPTELIFDRLFPLLPIKLFIDSIVFFGGYTPLKLAGVAGSLAGQLAVAAAGGVAYTLFLRRADRRAPAPAAPGAGAAARTRWVDPRGWALVVPGVLVVWLASVALLWPNLLTSYRGLPPAPATLATSLALLAAYAACGLALMGFHHLLLGVHRPPPAPGVRVPGDGPLNRRAFLGVGLGAAVSLLLAALLRRLFRVGTFAYDGTEYLGPDVEPVTPAGRFYSVSKNLVDPEVDRALWRLEIGGEVVRPARYDWAQLTALPAVEQETTLLCISYRVGSGLTSNALWKGVPLRTLLEASGPRPGVPIAAVLFHALDGYYETFPYAKAMEPTTLVAYQMNGGPLPRRNGYPVRLIVPGLYGEKSPKWLTRIELLREGDPRLTRRHGCGFYKEQGWGPNFTVPTHARIDFPKVDGDEFADSFTVGETAVIRGMAFGGDRGIRRVELSLDDGRSWQEAPIVRPGTKISWSFWAYRWTPRQPGEYALRVRAIDGEGNLQVAEERGVVPQGATGLHRVEATVEAADDEKDQDHDDAKAGKKGDDQDDGDHGDDDGDDSDDGGRDDRRDPRSPAGPSPA